MGLAQKKNENQIWMIAHQNLRPNIRILDSVRYYLPTTLELDMALPLDDVVWNIL